MVIHLLMFHKVTEVVDVWVFISLQAMVVELLVKVGEELALLSILTELLVRRYILLSILDALFGQEFAELLPGYSTYHALLHTILQ